MRRLTAVLLFAATAAGVATLPVAPLGAVQKKKAAPAATPSPALDVPFSQGAKASLPLPKDVAGVWASAGTVADGKLALPADAPVGTRWVRAATAGGATAPRPVTLDAFPEVAEVPTNRSRDTPQALPVPCVVTGKADVEARAFFVLAVQKGKPLALEALARRLGSPFDPVIVLYHPDGRTVPGAYADDTPGLMGDARVVYTPPADGTVLAEVRDSTYKGGPEFTYRLRVGDFPGATTAFPLAVMRGQTATVTFTGPHAAGTTPVTLTAPLDPSVEAVPVVPTRGGAPGWPVWVKLSDSPQAMELEPNESPAAANPLANPGGVSARFAAAKDVDQFRFPVAKGQRYLVSVLTHELNSPAEVLLKVFDPAGKEIGQSDPTRPACLVEFAAAADGECVAACEHQNYLHGPAEVYHLSVRPLLPDFTVAVSSDRLALPAGGVGLLTGVKVDRLNGFAGPLTLAVVGDGLTGSGPAESPLGVTAADGKPGLRGLKLKATGVVNGVEVVRFASAAEPVRAALNGIPVVPPELANTVAVAVRPAVPFGLTVALESATVGPGGKLKVVVTVKRADGFDEPVTLTLLNPPAGVSAKPATVAKGATTATVEVSVAVDAAAGPAAVVVKGAAGSHEAVALPAAVAVAKKDKK